MQTLAAKIRADDVEGREICFYFVKPYTILVDDPDHLVYQKPMILRQSIEEAMDKVMNDLIDEYGLDHANATFTTELIF